MIRFGTTTDSKTKSRKRAPSTLSPPQNSKTEDLLSWLCLALFYVFMLSRFDLRLIASDSILTGGDSASWYQVLQTLKEDFLP